MPQQLTTCFFFLSTLWPKITLSLHDILLNGKFLTSFQSGQRPRAIGQGGGVLLWGSGRRWCRLCHPVIRWHVHVLLTQRFAQLTGTHSYLWPWLSAKGMTYYVWKQGVSLGDCMCYMKYTKGVTFYDVSDQAVSQVNINVAGNIWIW